MLVNPSRCKTALPEAARPRADVPRVGASAFLEDLADAFRSVTVQRGHASEAEADVWFHQFLKMETLGRLSAGVAHDFNRLLTVILGYGGLALFDVHGDAALRENLEEITRAATLGAQLTRQILAFSLKKAPDPVAIDLRPLLQDMEKLLRGLCSGATGTELSTLYGPGLRRVLGDPGQVEQIVMNLVLNARDAMPRGGRITLVAANVDLPDPVPHRHGVVPPGAYVRLAVTDTGFGMDAVTLARLFEGFFTTKAAGQGTGLGLSIVESAVKHCGGHLVVASEPGKGSTFAAYLPEFNELDADPAHTRMA